MQLHYGSRSQLLKAGDSQYFDGLLPHSFNNPTKRITRFLAVMGNLRDTPAAGRLIPSAQRPFIHSLLGAEQSARAALDEVAAAFDPGNSNTA
jgi:hypothetical protein